MHDRARALSDRFFFLALSSAGLVWLRRATSLINNSRVSFVRLLSTKHIPSFLVRSLPLLTSLDASQFETQIYLCAFPFTDIESPTPPLTPQQAVLASSASPAELAARFSEASADEVEALWQDVRAEDDKLKRFIEGDGRLMEWAGEVERLIKEGEEGEEADELVE